VAGIDAYLRLEHGEAYYLMLRQAMMARRSLLIVDGLDEGGLKRSEIERHVTQVLANQGHIVLVTSRPAGVNEQLFRRFQRLNLTPLTEAQQQQAAVQRLGQELADKLYPFLAERVPLDPEGARVTSNPLMLSMVASIFELREGVGMPNTIEELYDVASEKMLERTGDSEDAAAGVTQLLQAMFLRVHSAKQRVATKSDLEAARQQVPILNEETMRTLEERVANDRLPLLILSNDEPLEMQAVHLSFQEFFAAKALSAGRSLPADSPSPWPWNAWWANVIKFGLELGEAFSKGIIRESGIQGGSIHLTRMLELYDKESKLFHLQAGTVNLDGHTKRMKHYLQQQAGTPADSYTKQVEYDRKTIINAVSAMVLALTSMDVSGNAISAEEAKVIARALAKSQSLTKVFQFQIRSHQAASHLPCACTALPCTDQPSEQPLVRHLERV
jgi:hypothetical protein